MQGLAGTVEKLGESFWSYLEDRIHEAGQTPPLVELISLKAQVPRPICPRAPSPITPESPTTADVRRFVAGAGFTTSGRLAAPVWCNEAESGSLALRLARLPCEASHQPGYPGLRSRGYMADGQVT